MNPKKIRIKKFLCLDDLQSRFPSGISNYATTYQHDFTGKQGENRDFVFFYRSSESSAPDFALKPPIGMGRSLTPTCGRPSGH